MALPTLTQVINQYLYGSNSTPADLTNEELIDYLAVRKNTTIKAGNGVINIFY